MTVIRTMVTYLLHIVVDGLIIRARSVRVQLGRVSLLLHVWGRRHIGLVKGPISRTGLALNN